MGLLNRFSRLVRANVNYIVGGADDPEKALQQAVSDMQGDLLSMRQAVARAIATQKRTERQCEQTTLRLQEWYSRAQTALQEGDEEMARAALTHRQHCAQRAQSLKAQIAHHTDIVQQLKATMNTLEIELADARARKDMYIARARAAQSSAQLNAKLNGRYGRSSETVFEQMEARVLALEAQAEIARNLGYDPIERQFETLEGQTAVEDQLTLMKARLKRT